MSEPLLHVSNLKVSFKTDKDTFFEAVKNVSFDLFPNQTVALVGESGSGKSVSSLAIMGLLPEETTFIHEDSQIIFNGINLKDMPTSQKRKLCGNTISMIFQEPMTSLNPVFTVGFQIMETLKWHKGLSNKEAKKRAIELLEEVGIPNPASRLNAYPHQLSGGQQQRVMIAMAIACEPKLLIADEPTTALDMTVQKQIVDLIKKLQETHKMAVLFITHDLQLVSEIADAVIVMRHGEIQEFGSANQIFANPTHPYTKALMECRPRLDSRPWHLSVVEDILEAKEKNLKERTRGVQKEDPILLSVKNLKKSFFTREGFFRKKEFQAVKDVSFDLPKGKTLGVVGESGSGKTTVGLTLLRLHEPTGGKALFDGKDLFSMSEKEFLAYKKRIQIVFQNPFASLNPRFTIGQILMEPMRIHEVGQNAKERQELAYQWLDRVGLPKAAFFRYPHEFSGGQRQRIAIARCLTLQPEVLVCDESVSALDVSVQAQVLNLLQDLQDEFHISYLFISHDLSVVKYMADQVMVMQQGEVVEMADSDEIYQNPKHPYTKTLIEAIPKGHLAY